MKKIFDNALGLIHESPMIHLDKIHEKVYGKAEFMSATGSIKDRMVTFMIEEAEKKGKIKPGDTLIEATSGNTGVAFSMVSAVKGYHFIAVMPEFEPKERAQIMRAYGADVILTPSKDDMGGAYKTAKKLAKENGYFMFDQFANQSNSRSHQRFLGKEIWKEMKGDIAAFVAGVGTGGTLIGVGKYLKKKNTEIKIIAVEPTNSAVLSGNEGGSHKLYGIGEGFIPKIVKKNMDIIDEVILITDEEAFEYTRKLAKKEGLFVGITSGANVLASKKIADKLNGKVITVLPDTGFKYLSVEGLFGD